MAPGVSGLFIGFPDRPPPAAGAREGGAAFSAGRLPGRDRELSWTASIPLPASQAAEDQQAWQRYYELDTTFFTEALYHRALPTLFDGVDRADETKNRTGDMQVIQSALDFLGINSYPSTSISFDPEGGFLKCRAEQRTPADVEAARRCGWGVYPDGLEQVLLRIQERCHPAKVYITENGSRRWMCRR